jgi:FAD:protein FMN transferase
MSISAEGTAAAPAGTSLERVEDYFVGRFKAMGSPCEVLIDTDRPAAATSILQVVEGEAHRVEEKFSRYRSGSVIDRINHARGRPMEVDGETALLLDYAALCHEISGGSFDITSGVLRRIWKFDGSGHVPAEEEIQDVLRLVGWHRASWRRPIFSMPAGMEIDLGGLGKEYAVDRAAALASARSSVPFLVNFGGDLFAPRPRRHGHPWCVGVDDPERTGTGVLYRVDLYRGGLATSGDARRHILWQGRRLSHILDPRTGRPVEGAPSSATVVGRTCLEAGTLSTLAYLRGPEAHRFLLEQEVEFRLA